MDNKSHLKLVIVGHVDHGKSTLIGRLLYDTGSISPDKIKSIEETCKSFGKKMEFGYIVDYLEEEREKEMTIDTTQTFFKAKNRDYIIIDAPGHKEFIKNMMTGASQAEAAIIIVDAKEGIKEQTKRHSYILNMLGTRQVIVVINKMDLVNYKKERFEEIKKNLIKFLSSINISPRYVIPISAKEGENVVNKSNKMDWHSETTLLETLETFKVKRRPKEKPFRFPVQDIYKEDGKKIIVGRVESGIIETGEEVILFPSKKITKIKAIELFNERRTKAEAGESIGIIIEEEPWFERGEVFSEKTIRPTVTSKFAANVFWMSESNYSKEEKLILRCATQEIQCLIQEIQKCLDSSTLEVIRRNDNKIKNNEVGEVIIKTEQPIVVENFNNIPELGRFVLVKGSQPVAGGIINNI